MNVGELRKRLAAFDDDMEVLAAPRIKMELVGDGKQMGVPHPNIQQEITNLHVVGRIDEESREVTKRYVVLAYEGPGVPEGGQTKTKGRKSKTTSSHIYYFE